MSFSLMQLVRVTDGNHGNAKELTRVGDGGWGVQMDNPVAR